MLHSAYFRKIIFSNRYIYFYAKIGIIFAWEIVFEGGVDGVTLWQCVILWVSSEPTQTERVPVGPSV